MRCFLPRWAGVMLALLCGGRLALAAELCIYAKEDGAVAQVRSRAEIPTKYRSTARCFEAAPPIRPPPTMAAPQDIELSGATGRAQLATAIGQIDLRWPRAVTEIFGKTPERAVAEAAMAVSRALQSGEFGAVAQSMNQSWQVVFMDEKLPTAQIPSSLVSSCHPGWMTPPANIYIVAQRAAHACGGAVVTRSEADARLATILVHEMGHAVEYQLIPRHFSGDKMRAEGFAAWFEQYAARYSTLLAAAQSQQLYRLLAQQSLALQPGEWIFQGTPQDYGRASMYFAAIVSRRGVAGLMDVYRHIGASHLEFLPAVDRAVGWDGVVFDREVRRMLQH